ncbi:MAG: hypothetical protein QOH83_945, partial [Solirubrobacteraceae bacterium]|nr:hypothetical protein [Solirubrobacteraceae bacterium]
RLHEEPQYVQIPNPLHGVRDAADDDVE